MLRIYRIWDFFHYRYLQTLTNISAEKNSTIIFPLPMEILGPFMEV
jgi:hypothetical protein